MDKEKLEEVRELVYKALDGILEGQCKLKALSALEDALLVLEPILEGLEDGPGRT